LLSPFGKSQSFSVSSESTRDRVTTLEDDTEAKGLFEKHVESKAEKDEIELSDRIGSSVGIVLGLVAIAFFLVHLNRPTGFFTDEFDSLAALLFFAPQVLVIFHLAAQAIIGRQNMVRPLEAGNDALSLISVVYLFIVFPFDFSHFAEPFPRFLEFTISWISDGIAKFFMVILILVFAVMSIYNPLLYIHVRRVLNRRGSGI